MRLTVPPLPSVALRSRQSSRGYPRGLLHVLGDFDLRHQRLDGPTDHRGGDATDVTVAVRDAVGVEEPLDEAIHRDLKGVGFSGLEPSFLIYPPFPSVVAEGHTALCVSAMVHDELTGQEVRITP